MSNTQGFNRIKGQWWLRISKGDGSQWIWELQNWNLDSYHWGYGYSEAGARKLAANRLESLQ